jgi:hypothetical protein
MFLPIIWSVKAIRAAVAGLALIVALQAQTAAPAPTHAPWQPRPVIIVDPRAYLPSPTPRPGRTHRPTPHPHATPPHRHASPRPTPETFERLDTSPSPKPR